jgi:hypothetical protein
MGLMRGLGTMEVINKQIDTGTRRKEMIQDYMWERKMMR